ncbi:DUF6398 domain-containing protein [Agromyces sp. NPDC058484]|uniref:DUF6398 domain-containing protein n=1 Tax=Agromyces sp. NPDC058484 TaxID=3346524 RepID=UPI003667B68A
MARGHDRRRSDRRRGGHRPPQQRRVPPPRPVVDDDQLLQEPLLQGLDVALAQPHPLALLNFASGVVALSEPDQFADLRASAGGAARADRVELADLIESFLSVGLRQTDALLLVVKELIGDELLRRRIRTTVAARKRLVPGWLLRLDQVRPTQAVEFAHILGDGENVVLGVDLPGGRPMTIVVFVDHNLGTVVKDAFALDVPLDDVIERLQDIDDDHGGGITTREAPLADARARIEQALAHGRRLFEPLESDTWPMTRPLVEWMLRLMPEGGAGYSVPEWTQEQIDAVAADFLASTHGAGLDDDGRDILDHLLWFGAEYGTGDPLRHSPVTAEIVLLDLVPRKVVADAAYLDRVPDVLRALVRYSHQTRGVPTHYTRDTLAAIDEFEPEYRTAIRRPRHQGPMALLERIGAVPPLGDGDDDDFDEDFDEDFHDDETLDEYFLRLWADTVGGLDSLRNLDASPLPVEELDPSAVAGDIRDAVAHVGQLVAEACDALYDEEFRTVCYRMLSRIASADPGIFRRKGRLETAAAAVIWIASKNNAAFGVYGDVTVKAMMAQLGLTGSPAQRAQPMLAALGVARPFDWTLHAALGDPELLTSSYRRWIVERRDDLSASLDADDS